MVMAANTTDSLGPQQEQAILALLAEPSVSKAAQACGVPERTLYRWMDEAVFSRAYHDARRKGFSHGIGLVHRYAPVAVQTLAKIMVDERAPCSARVAAALGLLKVGREAIEQDDMLVRLVALEQSRPRGAA